MTPERIYQFVILELAGALIWLAVLASVMRNMLKPGAAWHVRLVALVVFALSWPVALFIWAGKQIRAFALAVREALFDGGRK